MIARVHKEGVTGVKLGAHGPALTTTTPTRHKTPFALGEGIDRRAERLVKNETRPACESGQDRCNLFARMEMARLQFIDASAKKF